MSENEQETILKPEEEASDEEFEAALREAQAAATVEEHETPAVAGEQLTALDSLQANEFVLELEGEPVEGVFRVMGLSTFQLEPVKPFQNRIKVAKMVQRNADLAFNQWIRETVEAGNASEDRPTRTLAVVAIDDGEETRRWTLKDAYIESIRYSPFDTASSDFVEEQLKIRYEELIESWTWNDNQ